MDLVILEAIKEWLRKEGKFSMINQEVMLST